MNTHKFPADLGNSPALKMIPGFFLALFGAAVLLALTILILPDKLFLAIGNYLQIIAALTVTLVLLYSWNRQG